MYKDITPPSAFAPEVSQAVDSIVLGALVRDRGMRYQTAREMAVAIEEALAPATSREVSEWLSTVASDALFKRAHMVAAIERDSISDVDQDVLIPDSVRFSTDSARSLPDSVRTGATPATGTAVISGVGMQPEDDSPAPSKAKRIAAWAAAAVVVGGVVSALAFLDRTPSSTASSAVEATASAPPAAPIASATATASASPSATVSATASAAASVQRPKVQNPTTSPKPKADCTNPFRIDADGKKRPRPECFK
jgi:serine/threonine-protein kinase